MSNNLHPVEGMLHSGGLVFLLCVLHKSTTFSKQQIDNVEKARDSIAKSVCMSTKNKLATLRRQWDHFCTQATPAWQPYWVCLLIIIIMYTLVHWSISPGCPLFDLTPLEYCSLLAWLVGWPTLYFRRALKAAIWAQWWALHHRTHFLSISEMGADDINGRATSALALFKRCTIRWGSRQEQTKWGEMKEC